MEYIKTLTDRGLAPTKEMVQGFASQIAQKSVGEKWVKRFLGRMKDELTFQYAAGMDSVRHKADSEDKHNMYFDLLHQKIEEYKIEPRNTYNMDEKGFLIGVIGKSKRIFSKQAWEQKKIRSSLQDGSREWITLLACVGADGTALPPSLIYQAASGNLQSTWVQDIQAEEHSVFVTSSQSGGTNNELGLAWLKQVFERFTREKAGYN